MRKLSDLRLDHSDRWVVLLSVVAIVSSAALLWQDGWLRKLAGFTSEEGQSMGVVAIAAQDVRRRMSSSLAWIPVEAEEAVYENDSIFTGENSEAMIRLDEFGEISLSPNSLVILRKSQNDLLFDLQLGRFRAQLAQGKSLHLMQGGAVAVVEGKGSDNLVNFRRDRNGKLSVSPLQGKVDVRLNDQGSTATPQQSLETTGRDMRAKSIPIALRAPVGGRRIWLDEGGALKFEWDVVLSPGENQRIQISKSESFEQAAVMDETPSTAYLTRDLKDEGVYYWRIQGQNQGQWNSASTVGEFTLLRKAAPLHEYPYDGLSLQTGGRAAKVELRWQEKRGVEGYRVQVARDASFADVVLDKTTVHSKLAGVELTPGLFHWRVKVEGASPISDRWSQPTIFGVDRKPGAPEIAPLAENPGPEGGTPETFEDDLKAEQELAGQNMEKPQEPEVKPETTVALAKPELVSGEDERLELDFPEADDRSPASMANLSPTNAPKMKWSKVEGAEVYEIEIAENKEFAGKKIYLGSKSDLAFWRDALAGEFFWRVRARSGESVSDFSEIGHFLIDLPAPVVKKETTLSPSDGDEVQHQWGWDPLPRALGYEVVLGSDGSLEEGEVLKVKEAKLDYKFQEGSTYIKVAALGVGDRKVSSYSGVGLVKVVKQLKLNSPKVVRPENGLTIISFGSGSNPVAFGWSEVDKAQSYRIQFSSSADFAEISDEKVIEQTQLVLSSDDFDGEIFWRLRSEAGKNVSAWSAPRHFKTEKK